MTRTHFDHELQRLNEDILVLGSMVEHALGDAVDALLHQDLARAERLILEDGRVNDKHLYIESTALALIATQQPMARDMRTLAAVLEIATELERIGDYAKTIAKITLMIGGQPHIKPLVDIPRMAEYTIDMLTQALAAFVQRNVELAVAVARKDDLVDALNDQVYRELFTSVLANPRSFEQANRLLWVSHNLERAADRITNICERVVYTVSGTLVELDQEGSRIANQQIAAYRASRQLAGETGTM